MKTTTNHGLKKPDGTDTVNIEDLNYNSDVLDGLLTPATITTNGFMSKEDKVKLNGVATGANNYTHPATHPASMISGLHAVATSGSYNDILNKPATFPPSTHTHAKSQITDFPASLPANGGDADTVDGKHASDFLPSTGGTVSGNLAVGGTADFLGNVGIDKSLYLKVNNLATDVGTVLESLITPKAFVCTPASGYTNQLDNSYIINNIAYINVVFKIPGAVANTRYFIGTVPFVPKKGCILTCYNKDFTISVGAKIIAYTGDIFVQTGSVITGDEFNISGVCII